MPDYEGSDEYKLSPIPDVEVNYRDIVVLRTMSLSVDLFKATGFVGSYHGWTGGPRLKYGTGRDQDDNDALRGLGDVDGSMEAGGFLGYRIGGWSAELAVLQDVGDGHEGLTAELAGGYRMPLSDRLSASLRGSLTYADESYMQSFFGISAAQSLRSGYAPYEAGAGLKDAGLTLGLAYKLTDNWSVNGFVGYKRLLADAADSPIVDDAGSANQFRTGLTLSYGF
jgi:outer membrane scaffolding protein for murein synthesis (MipA/OmpV family)